MITEPCRSPKKKTNYISKEKKIQLLQTKKYHNLTIQTFFFSS